MTCHISTFQIIKAILRVPSFHGITEHGREDSTTIVEEGIHEWIGFVRYVAIASLADSKLKELPIIVWIGS
jgi:hypothetical protein